MPSLKAALWAAVSSKPQAEKISNQEQLRLGHAAADKLGAQVVAELVVPGESRNIVLFEDAARRIEAYAALKQLIDTAAVDVLIYLDRSRLGRQASLSMAVVALCAQAGIATYELDAPPADLTQGGSTQDVYLGAIKSAGAQAEIEKLRQRHRMGMIGRVRKGKAANKVAYGYRIAYDAHGARQVVIDEAAATVVQRLVTLYLAGHGGEYIATVFNAEGILSPGGTTWIRSTVIALLKGAHWWAGIAAINRRSRTGRPYVEAPAQWPPIIDAATYAALLEERQARRAHRRLATGRYLLSGICICQVCGGNMIVAMRKRSGYRHLLCRQHGHYVSIREEPVLSVIREQLALLREVDITNLLEQGDGDATAKLAERIQTQQAAIARTQQAMQRIDTAYADGTLDTERYRLQVERLKAQAVQAAAEIERLQALADSEAAAGTRRQRLEYARDNAAAILDGDPGPANVFLRHLLRVWCADKTVISLEWR